MCTPQHSLNLFLSGAPPGVKANKLPNVSNGSSYHYNLYNLKTLGCKFTSSQCVSEDVQRARTKARMSKNVFTSHPKTHLHVYLLLFICAIIMEWSVIFDACFNCMRLNKTVGLNQSTDTFWSMCAEAVTVLRPQGVNTVCIKEVTKESFKSSVDTRSTHILLSLAVIPSTRGRRYRI